MSDNLYTVSMAPHIRSNASTASIMLDVAIALIPSLVFGIYNFGLRALIIILICVISCIASEYLYEKLMKKPVTVGDCSALVTGLILAVNLPSTVPFWLPVIGGAFAIIVVKMLFGGLGQNFMNPALAARCFLLISFTSLMTNFPVVDGVSSATPLTSLKSGGSADLLKMFLGTHSGCIGETSAAAILIGAGYLLFRKVISIKIPLSVVLSSAAFIALFSALNGSTVTVPYLLAQICGGGLLSGAVFMATDPVTSAVTPVGQILQGFLLGIITVVFRFIGVEGVAYSILIINAVVFLLDKIGMRSRFNFIRSLIWFVFVWLIIIGVTIGVALTRKTQDNKDPNFEIIDKTMRDNITVYTVTQKGYGGKIEAVVQIENNRIVSIEVTSHRETANRYQLIIDSNYITQLIDNQDNLDNVDTISSATVTSTALKNMLENVMKDYK